MAQHTKQPEVLQELFEALGNDPFVIAECLARPVLAERLAANLSAHDKDQRFASLRTQAAGNKFRITTSGKATYTLLEIDPCTDDTWTPTSVTSAPDGRQFHTAVWTGSEMIVWGGYTEGLYIYFNTRREILRAIQPPANPDINSDHDTHALSCDQPRASLRQSGYGDSAN